MNDKRYIESVFPVWEVSQESAKEKSIRHGHPSTLHIWWARRPLASSRATIYTSLVSHGLTSQEMTRKKRFIIDLCKWKNSLNQELLQEAKQDIVHSIGKEPKILDPFAGGGTIPLEASRLGCTSYSMDYNPVAVLVEKCTAEYPQKYGKKLATDVQLWGNFILREAKKELEKFYPPAFMHSSNEKSNYTTVGYIWSRIITCTKCNAEIPLMRQYWLARKCNRKISLFPSIQKTNGKAQVRFKIVGTGYENFPENFIPKNGTVKRSRVKCPVCENRIEPYDVKMIFRDQMATQRMIAIVYRENNEKGKKYRIATQKDHDILNKVASYLDEKRAKLRVEWGIDPVPVENLTSNYNSTAFGILRYGITKWSELFNSRQLLAFITFCEKIREAYKELMKINQDEQYVKAVVSYLGLTLDRVASYNSKFGRWHVTGEKATDLFAIQNIGWVWDYCETNPLAENFSWKTNLNWILRYLKHAIEMKASPVIVKQASATKLPFKDNFFDAVITDPPYYDNITYSDLSDFFFVLLKRSIGFLYPDQFQTELTPKEQEIIACTSRHKTKEKAKAFFESKISASFCEIRRVLKPKGIVVIVYAHRSNEGWETFINALLDSKLRVTASWPIATEMRGRLKARKSSVLKSSIYIIARKNGTEERIEFNRFKKELSQSLNKKLEFLLSEGITGIDFSMAAIGAGLEIICKYRRIVENGQEMKAGKLLSEIVAFTNDFSKKKNQ
jgi:adenine-specific DNA methylase